MDLKRPSQSGFSLLETLLGILIMTLSVIGSFEVLRLGDLKASHTRVDRRISELLRESSDFVLYVAYDLLPQDGSILSQGSLYQLYDSRSQSWQGFYNYTVTAEVRISHQGTASESKNITLKMTYQVDGELPGSALKPQTIDSDVISRRKS
jgi:hypothetical protein